MSFVNIEQFARYLPEWYGVRKRTVIVYTSGRLSRVPTLPSAFYLSTLYLFKQYGYLCRIRVILLSDTDFLQ